MHLGEQHDAVFGEAAASGLDLQRLPGNSAKLRLLLDLAALIREQGRLRVLDVGCAGLYHPFELWEPVLPWADRLELVGVDVGHLEPTKRRAEEIGFPLEVELVSALELVEAFGRDRFDVVVSTQVLEHLPAWPAALREMRDVLRPGGTLLVTCDSGDYARARLDRARLAGKRVFSRAASAAPALRRLASGDWELGPTRRAVEQTVARLGMELQRLAWYGLRDVKAAQSQAGSRTRLLWLALEEALEAEADGTPRPELYQLLYLRARTATMSPNR